MKRRARDTDKGNIYLVRETGMGSDLPGMFAEPDHKGGPPRLICCDLEGSLLFGLEFSESTGRTTIGFDFQPTQHGLDAIVVNTARYIDSAWQRRFYGRQLEKTRKKFEKVGIQLPQLDY